MADDEHSGQRKESQQKPTRVLAAIHQIKINCLLIAIADHSTSKPDDSNWRHAADDAEP